MKKKVFILLIPIIILIIWIGIGAWSIKQGWELANKLQQALIVFQGGGYLDLDRDGVGEYGCFPQWSGQWRTDMVNQFAIQLINRSEVTTTDTLDASLSTGAPIRGSTQIGYAIIQKNWASNMPMTWAELDHLSFTELNVYRFEDRYPDQPKRVAYLENIREIIQNGERNIPELIIYPSSWVSRLVPVTFIVNDYKSISWQFGISEKVYQK